MKKIFLMSVLLSHLMLHGQMNKWMVNDKIVDPDLGTYSTISSIGNNLPDYSYNALFNADGTLAVYAIDGNIYDADGNLFASLLFHSDVNCPNPNDRNHEIGMGYSECIFVRYQKHVTNST